VGTSLFSPPVFLADGSDPAGSWRLGRGLPTFWGAAELRGPPRGLRACVHGAIKSIYANGDLPGLLQAGPPPRFRGRDPWGCPTGGSSALGLHCSLPTPSPASLPARRGAEASPEPRSLSKASSLALPAVVAWAGIRQGKRRGLPGGQTPVPAHQRAVPAHHGRSGGSHRAGGHRCDKTPLSPAPRGTLVPARRLPALWPGLV